MMPFSVHCSLFKVKLLVQIPKLYLMYWLAPSVCVCVCVNVLKRMKNVRQDGAGSGKNATEPPLLVIKAHWHLPRSSEASDLDETVTVLSAGSQWEVWTYINTIICHASLSTVFFL